MRVSAATIRPDSWRKRCSPGSTAVLHLHDRTDFHEPAGFKDGATLREFCSFAEILGLNQCVAAYNIFGLRIGAIGHRLLFSPHDFSCPVERLTAILNVALLAELRQPRNPLLHFLLSLLRRIRPFSASVQVHEFAHSVNSLVWHLIGTSNCRRLRHAMADILFYAIRDAWHAYPQFGALTKESQRV